MKERCLFMLSCSRHVLEYDSNTFGWRNLPQIPDVHYGQDTLSEIILPGHNHVAGVLSSGHLVLTKRELCDDAGDDDDYAHEEARGAAALLYAISSGTWSSLQWPAPMCRCGMGFWTVVLEGKLICGGMLIGFWTSEVDGARRPLDPRVERPDLYHLEGREDHVVQYDPLATGSKWSSLPFMPKESSKSMAVATKDNKLLLLNYQIHHVLFLL